MTNEGRFYKFLLWREAHIKERTFILIVSFIVGLAAAIAAQLLKFIIHSIQHLLMGHFQQGANYWLLVYPIAGILLAGLFVRYIVRDDISHGVTKILYAISQRKSRIKPHNIWSSLIASSVTIGFGGSVGAEAPIDIISSDMKVVVPHLQILMQIIVIHWVILLLVLSIWKKQGI